MRRRYEIARGVRSLHVVRPTTPVKVTSGAGFAFEDRVAAYLCSALLASGPFLDPDLGPPHRIDFQVKADGWAVHDDVLVTFAPESTTVRWCVSINDSAYIGASAPREFVSHIWEEPCGVSGSGFDSGTDLVGLVTAPLAGSTFGDLQELIRLARHQDPGDLARRVGRRGYVSEKRRALALVPSPHG